MVVPLVACAIVVEAAGAAPSSPQLIARVGTRGAKPCGSAVYGKYLYVANYGSGTLARINPRTNKATKTVAVGDGPCGVVAGGGALWVENFRRSNSGPSSGASTGTGSTAMCAQT
jgi:YVTN family beta-propeller protein